MWCLISPVPLHSVKSKINWWLINNCMFALVKYDRTEISFFLRLVYLLIRGCIQRINFSANIHFPTCFFTLSIVTQLLFHSFNFFDHYVSRKFHDNSSIITLHKFNNRVFSSYKGFSSHVTSWTSTCLMRLRSEETSPIIALMMGEVSLKT